MEKTRWEGEVPATEVPEKPARFVRHVPGNLPEPTIIFAHHGGTDPVTEGWKLQTDRRNKLGRDGLEARPVVEDGTAAWELRRPGNTRMLYYDIRDRNSMTPELIEEAWEKGWVLRARIWMRGRPLTALTPENKGPCGIAYRGNRLHFGFHVCVDQEGNQCLDFPGRNPADLVTHSVPGSRDRYVDYEVRCDPASKTVDLLIDGRCVATQIPMAKSKEYPTVRFGMSRYDHESDMRFAKVEWGILRNKPDAAAEDGSKNPDKETLGGKDKE